MWVKFITFLASSEEFPFTHQLTAVWSLPSHKSPSGLRVTNDFLTDKVNTLKSLFGLSLEQLMSLNVELSPFHQQLTIILNTAKNGLENCTTNTYLPMNSILNICFYSFIGTYLSIPLSNFPEIHPFIHPFLKNVFQSKS